MSARAVRGANHPWAIGAVFSLEVLASAVLPIPNSLTMVGVVTAAPRKWARFAASLTCGSLVGGLLLYIIGRVFFVSVGARLIAHYGAEAQWVTIASWFGAWQGLLFLCAAGLSAGLFRVACIGAGFTAMNPVIFLVILALSRSARWFGACAAIRYVGDRVRSWPVRYVRYATVGLALILLLSLALALRT